jgi:hypothetical protein
MDITPAADLRLGQSVRVTGRGHLGRCGCVAFFVGDEESSETELWVDFGGGQVVPVERWMVEPINHADDIPVVDPVTGGLEALRTSWPSSLRGLSG